jgi:myo-inositol-1-phosphate synthase
MKSPPEQYSDAEAHSATECFITESVAEIKAAKKPAKEAK